MPTTKSLEHSGAANAQQRNKPRTRQRLYKAPAALDVPDINDDATERKRVLNVLAQRRYREKRRQRREVGSATASGSSGETDSTNGKALASNKTLILEEDGPEPTVSLEATATVATPDSVNGSSVSSWDLRSLDVSSPSLVMSASDLAIDGSELEGVHFSAAYEASSFEDCSSRISPGSLNQQALFSTSSPSDTLTDGIDLSFPDSYLLPVNQLTIMRAFFKIGARLGCKSNLFDLHSLSPFADPSTPVSHLPQTWQPTAAQLLIPHHPILDFLPWPSVREKILYTLTLPEEMRPSVAKNPTALVDFAHDLEDNAEGIRIWGADVEDPSSWEVGQQLFQRWWFLFDRRIIEQSNTWRTLRGAARLRITSPAPGSGNGQYSAGLAI